MRDLVWNNRWTGAAQNRVRRFTFGHREWGAFIERLVAVRAFEAALRASDVGLEASEYVPAVCASGSTWIPVKLGGSGKVKKTKRVGGISGDKSARYLRDAIKAQGLPDDFDLPGFTVREKVRAVGNGVPLPLGRAVARAVKAALSAAEKQEVASG